MDQFRTGNYQPFDNEYLTDGGGAALEGTLVGVAIKNGVVMAADTRTSHGSVIRSEGVQKFAQVHPTAAMGSTDDLGTSRSFVRAIRAEVDLYETRRGESMDLMTLSTFAAGELRSEDDAEATFVLGGVDNEGSHVFTLSPAKGALEHEYAAVGNGQQITYGLLDAKETETLTMPETRRLTVQAIRHAAERDARTGTGFHVAEITAAGVDIQRYESFDGFS